MRNPIRRNKNIGKTQGGRVIDGKPWEKWSRIFAQNVWEQLSDLSGPCKVLIENPSRKFFHPCSAEDYFRVLEQLPRDLTAPVKAIVLRRTSKHDVKLGIDARKTYSCILMNSFPRSNQYFWRSRPTAETVRHYDPWCSNWIQKSDGWILNWTVEQIRHYFLYHLFLHEIGHFHEPLTNSSRKCEAFAEDFALNWARNLGAL